MIIQLKKIQKKSKENLKVFLSNKLVSKIFRKKLSDFKKIIQEALEVNRLNENLKHLYKLLNTDK